MPTASLRDATVVLDDRAILRRISLEIQPGLTILRGANGAGKTTVLRAIAGLATLSGGTRRVDGSTLFLGHRPMLLRGLTAHENLTFLARFRGRPVGAVTAALSVWGLGSDMHRPVDRLSAGQRRRASLARLETELEDVVLLDEPFADLDAEGIAHVRVAISDAIGRGQTLLLVTHLHYELDELAAQRLVVDAGAVRAE